MGGQLKVPSDAVQASTLLYVIGANTTGRYHDFDCIMQRRAVGTTGLEPKAVDNTKLADVATGILKGRASAGTGSPEDITPAQLVAFLNAAAPYFPISVTPGTPQIWRNGEFLMYS